MKRAYSSAYARPCDSIAGNITPKKLLRFSGGRKITTGSFKRTCPTWVKT